MKWLVEVPLHNPYLFCPYDENTGDVITGINVLSEQCGGELVGIFHSDGEEALQKWCNENPGWEQDVAKIKQSATA